MESANGRLFGKQCGGIKYGGEYASILFHRARKLSPVAHVPLNDPLWYTRQVSVAQDSGLLHSPDTALPFEDCCDDPSVHILPGVASEVMGGGDSCVGSIPTNVDAMADSISCFALALPLENYLMLRLADVRDSPHQVYVRALQVYHEMVDNMVMEVDAMQFCHAGVVPRFLLISDQMAHVIFAYYGRGDMSVDNSMNHHIGLWLPDTSGCQLVDFGSGWGTDRMSTDIQMLDVMSTCFAHFVMPGISTFTRSAFAGCMLVVECCDTGVGYIFRVTLVDASWRPRRQEDIFLQVAPSDMMVADNPPYVVDVFAKCVVARAACTSADVWGMVHAEVATVERLVSVCVTWSSSPHECDTLSIVVMYATVVDDTTVCANTSWVHAGVGAVERGAVSVCVSSTTSIVVHQVCVGDRGPLPPMLDFKRVSELHASANRAHCLLTIDSLISQKMAGVVDQLPVIQFLWLLYGLEVQMPLTRHARDLLWMILSCGFPQWVFHVSTDLGCSDEGIVDAWYRPLYRCERCRVSVVFHCQPESLPLNNCRSCQRLGPLESSIYRDVSLPSENTPLGCTMLDASSDGCANDLDDMGRDDRVQVIPLFDSMMVHSPAGGDTSEIPQARIVSFGYDLTASFLATSSPVAHTPLVLAVRHFEIFTVAHVSRRALPYVTPCPLASSSSVTSVSGLGVLISITVSMTSDSTLSILVSVSVYGLNSEDLTMPTTLALIGWFEFCSSLYIEMIRGYVICKDGGRGSSLVDQSPQHATQRVSASPLGQSVDTRWRDLVFSYTPGFVQPWSKVIHGILVEQTPSLCKQVLSNSALYLIITESQLLTVEWVRRYHIWMER